MMNLLSLAAKPYLSRSQPTQTSTSLDISV